MNRRVAVTLAVLALVAGAVAASAAVQSSVERFNRPGSLALDVQAGDLVFRRGRGIASLVVLALDPSSRFSHVGIVVKNYDQWAVIHSVPDSGAGAGSGVVLTPLSEYLAPEFAVDAGIYRVALPGGATEVASTRAVQEAWKYLARRTPFDDNYDSSGDAAVYCTELVWRAYIAAGVDLAPSGYWAQVPGVSGHYIMPSVLMSSTLLVRK